MIDDDEAMAYMHVDHNHQFCRPDLTSCDASSENKLMSLYAAISACRLIVMLMQQYRYHEMIDDDEAMARIHIDRIHRLC